MILLVQIWQSRSSLVLMACSLATRLSTSWLVRYLSPICHCCLQVRLPDGSLCCPTKPIPTALPPVPLNDAPLTWPQYMNAKCQFNIAGNGQPGVVISASINCQTADSTDVLMYMGPALLKFSANFKGIVLFISYLCFVGVMRGYPDAAPSTTLTLREYVV